MTQSTLQYPEPPEPLSERSKKLWADLVGVNVESPGRLVTFQVALEHLDLADEAKRQRMADGLMIALGLDRELLRGDGSGAEPEGFENWNGINTLDVGGALSGYSNVLTAMRYREDDNHVANAIVMNPTRKYAFAVMLNGEGGYLEPPKEWDQLKKLVTTQGESSKLYVGDFSRMYVGIRDQLRIQFSQEAGDTSDSAFSKMQVWVRAFLRADVLAAHEDAFCLMSGIS